MKIELSKDELKLIKTALNDKHEVYEKMAWGPHHNMFRVHRKEIKDLVAVIDVFLTRVADES